MDYTRKTDLEDLQQAKRSAPSQYQPTINRSMDKIRREDPVISQDREKLAGAIRSGDTRGANMIREEINNKVRSAFGDRYGR
jgi:hypothetical protein